MVLFLMLCVITDRDVGDIVDDVVIIFVFILDVIVVVTAYGNDSNCSSSSCVNRSGVFVAGVTYGNDVTTVEVDIVTVADFNFDNFAIRVVDKIMFMLSLKVIINALVELVYMIRKY